MTRRVERQDPGNRTERDQRRADRADMWDRWLADRVNRGTK